ncbi:archaetidylserine decarboxylase [Sinimarinibacterium sp. NLF-5-8]|uniref:archaetidylserine decarboxylase n=1 Tax=Sinimarinibacterium sp. NLF-5-8 TaxID=2698684 RepID=UPI00137BB246|nr:archaetidylserine decarboxylase [Sinimarinibacterium sp. NLF-5-8]QHS09178.1 phosphatidylserine decarboxylase [Sinimarinibacterium sp. NLF-5-8]
MNPVPEPSQAHIGDRAFVLLQWMLPTRWLSTLIFRLSRIRHDGFKNALIKLFMRGFKIDLSEAQFNYPQQYESFNHFFTRALQPGARPLPDDAQTFVSPVDGTISQFGEIEEGLVFQAKGHRYSVLDLLGGDEKAALKFMHGRFCTIYLAPYNYHRIHMPIAGTLKRWSYVPGRLFSVNAATARAMPKLFARNERVNAIFDTAAGDVGVTLVGALFVGSIETVWAGCISPPHLRGEPIHYQPTNTVTLDRAEELGRFNMGSTVILLTEADAVNWQPDLAPGQAVRMGQALGQWRARNQPLRKTAENATEPDAGNPTPPTTL